VALRVGDVVAPVKQALGGEVLSCLLAGRTLDTHTGDTLARRVGLAHVDRSVTASGKPDGSRRWATLARAGRRYGAVASFSVGAVCSDMELPGERECTDCGARWSYYETGEVTCPECGSIRSVGVGDPATHTAGTERFDLSAVREQVEERPLRRVADEAADVAADYLRTAGFVHAGELRPLTDTYLAAAELRRVGATLGRLMEMTDTEEIYFLTLLRGADHDERPASADVPRTLSPERSLAVAAAVDAYLSDLRQVRDGTDRPLDRALSPIRSRQKRIEALDGEIDPAEAEQLVRAVRDVSAYYREGDETALVRATERFDSG
jgi:uncharacterized Zn finger protein (UPF0148 family)